MPGMSGNLNLGATYLANREVPKIDKLETILHINIYLSEKQKSFFEEKTFGKCKLHPSAVSCSTAKTFLVQNPDIPRAGRVRANGGAASGSRAKPDANRIVCSGDKGPF